MILCNLGETRYDKRAALTFKMKCDEFMHKVVEIMGINLGTYRYTQKFELGYKKIGDNNYKILLKGHYKNEPCTCVESITLKVNNLTKELDQSNLTKNYEVEITVQPGSTLPVVILFREAYQCNPMELDLSLNSEEAWTVLEFEKIVSYE